MGTELVEYLFFFCGIKSFVSYTSIDSGIIIFPENDDNIFILNKILGFEPYL